MYYYFITVSLQCGERLTKNPKEATDTIVLRISVNSVDSVRKFRSRLMKDGKPDEYATDEASNVQFADSP
uniref:Uncharacterized protein n=1 Tax=Caenorhabditis japonica TaxID=281687 RepID=A0A8R1EDZ4_CAEJA